MCGVAMSAEALRPFVLVCFFVILLAPADLWLFSILGLIVAMDVFGLPSLQVSQKLVTFQHFRNRAQKAEA